MKLFVAGSTGATGKILVPIAREMGISLVAHRRNGAAGPDEVVCDLGDQAALDAAMTGCTTVIQLIGTMRSRFAGGDTYETSDIGTTQKLVEAAKRTGVSHVILLSSVGAGRPVGTYLKAKARTEDIVRHSGIAYTCFRPSMLVGGDRKAPPGMMAFTKLFRWSSARPIRIEDLSLAMLKCALDRAPTGGALEGDSLWNLVRDARG